MPWIKCSDEMPPRSDMVLVCRGHYIVITRLVNGWGKNSNRIYWEGHAAAGLDYFDHWMPLPDPPCTESAPVANAKLSGPAVAGPVDQKPDVAGSGQATCSTASEIAK